VKRANTLRGELLQSTTTTFARNGQRSKQSNKSAVNGTITENNEMTY